MSYENAAEQVSEEVLAVEAEAVAPVKRERKPKLDADGNPVVKAVRAPKEPKEPKAPKLYPQWNEDGSPLLDSEGNQVMLETRMKKPKAPRAPRVDADGNPIERRVVAYRDDQVIRRTEKGQSFSPRPDSKRGQMFAAASDGKTIGEFYAEMGGKSVAHTFIVWFDKVAEVVTVE
jgi:hypothetical protein